MSRTLAAAVAVTLTACALVGAGWFAGVSHAEGQHQQAKLDEAVEANRIYRAAQANGERAVENHLSQQREQEARYADLDRRYRTMRKGYGLAVQAPAAFQSTGLVADAACGPLPDGEALPPDGTAAGPVAVPALTLAAVRMWNGSLTGADAAAGACGADGAAVDADSACGQASGLTLDDAWDNHAANAKSCALDRARHQALIDFLKQRESAP
jgi:hypothetical protein